MKKYRRMTWTDRLIIERLYNSGASYPAISRKVGFSVSSVYAEVQRGLYDHLNGRTWEVVKRYSAQIADDAARWSATSKGRPVKLGSRYDYVQHVASRIHGGESPDAIVGDLRKKGEWTVSTNTLYRYIDNGYIPGVTNKNLLLKSRQKRKYHKVRASRPPKGNSIERRPDIVSDRCTFGHWELDTVVGKAKGKGQALMVLTERLTRFEIISKLPDKTSNSIIRALSKTAKRLPKGTFQSITCDNGSEFQDYDTMRKIAPVYYCHPYSSWERGSNENANKLIRRFFPKGQSLKDRTQRDCDAAADFINHMHRKSLGYHTAQELFDFHLAALT